ncbi:hypothetical protein KLPMCK396B_18455 [Klebsiella pneumoniae]|nr:Uncharacterised protein [Klebsiella variicola]
MRQLSCLAPHFQIKFTSNNGSISIYYKSIKFRGIS